MEPTKGDRRIVQIRGMEVELWAALRSEAVRRRCSTSTLLGQIVREWMADRPQREPAEVA